MITFLTYRSKRDQTLKKDFNSINTRLDDFIIGIQMYMCVFYNPSQNRKGVFRKQEPTVYKCKQIHYCGKTDN